MEDGARRALISAHYGRRGLEDAIRAALRDSAKGTGPLVWDDLAAFDQLHSGGRRATLALAALADLRRGERVLDVGGGLGGPARALAATVGCDVTVLDLTEVYCRAGEMLTRRTGLADLVRFTIGDALAMPYRAEHFDVVWAQHTTMNVAEKERLFGEIGRLVRPAGRLALHEVVAAGPGAADYPVPWAPTAALSFLRSAAELRALVTAAGFVELAWRDVSDSARAWFRRATGGKAPGAPLGAHLALGADFAQSTGNLARNLETGRMAIVTGVFERA